MNLFPLHLFYILIFLPLFIHFIILPLKSSKSRTIILIPILVSIFALPYITTQYDNLLWGPAQLLIVTSVYTIIRINELIYCNEPASLTQNNKSNGLTYKNQLTRTFIYCLCPGHIDFNVKYINSRLNLLKTVGIKFIIYQVIGALISYSILSFHSKYDYYKYNQTNIVIHYLYHILHGLLTYTGAKAMFSLIPLIITLLYGNDISLQLEPWGDLHLVTSLKQFWNEWNNPIYSAFYNYTYKLYGKNILLVFFASGLLHEWASFCTVGTVQFNAFIFFVIQVPALFIERYIIHKGLKITNTVIRRTIVYIWLAFSCKYFLDAFGMDPVQMSKMNLGQEYNNKIPL